jgi:hypothetical protein
MHGRRVSKGCTHLLQLRGSRVLRPAQRGVAPLAGRGGLLELPLQLALLRLRGRAQQREPDQAL